MNSTPNNNPTALTLKCSIELPAIGDSAPGPIHTVVQDEYGNIYYSDEINNAVVSLHPEGTERWSKRAQGPAAGEFRYPRGISLGWIRLNAQMVRCLAVCDGWNRRIQFLGLQGELLGVWTSDDKKSFADPVDVRFIKKSVDHSTETDEDCWYVLDKGNHCLYAFGLDGSLQSKTGRCFPPNLERRWTPPEMQFEKGLFWTGAAESPPCFDFLYYPERILGKSNDCLFVWEPYSRRIKLAHSGNLFPVHLNTETNLEWIAVDLLGLIGWNRSSSRLSVYSHRGELVNQADIKGVPLSSNLPLGEIFIQNQQRLERWNWARFESESPKPPQDPVRSILICSAKAELSALDIDRSREAFDCLIARIDEHFTVLGHILMPEIDDPNGYLYEGAGWYLPRARGWQAPLEKDFREAIHPWCVGALESCLLGIGAEILAPHLVPADALWKEIGSKIRERRDCMQRRREEIAAMRQSKQAAAGSEMTRLEAWNRLADAAEQDLKAVLLWLESCCERNAEEKEIG